MTPQLQFGINVDPGVSALQLAMDLAGQADRLGIDLIGIQDHPYNGAFLDTWTLLSVLGARTSRVRLFTNVADLPLRPPAILAKSAASLDILTDGRVELGLGAGALWDAIAGYGGPRRTPAEAVQALEEAIEVIRLIWGAHGDLDAASYAGSFYRLERAQPGPVSRHPIGIWLGALKPRMLRLTGRAADGWSVSENYVPPDRIPQMQAIIDEAALEAGRDPLSIRRNYNLMGNVQPVPSSSLRARHPGIRIGTPDEWVEAIVRYTVELRMDTFIFWPIAGDEREQLQFFGEEIVPAVRERVGG
jgi:alkanesulfonate monooxygenase SsuD/methylene tetrahydromethanopterin reductase-like flavin-dependent oxidoreductase (luciferase family)